MAKILIVDDNHALRTALERYLRIRGHVATAVADAESALEEVARTRPDVLVTDLKMPGMDGAALIRSLGRLDVDVPVILMSAAEPQAAEASGAALVLSKPFGPTDLCDAIDRVIAEGPERSGLAGA